MNPEFVNPVRAAKAIDLTAIPRYKIEVASQKVEIIRRYRMLKNSGCNMTQIVPHFLDQVSKDFYGISVSARTIRRWDVSCPSLDRIEEAIKFFIDTRGGRNKQDDELVSENAVRVFLGLYLIPGLDVGVQRAWELTREIASKRGWNWCQRRHAYRLLQDRTCPSTRCLYRCGERQWRSYFGGRHTPIEVAFISDVPYPNENGNDPEAYSLLLAKRTNSSSARRAEFARGRASFLPWKL